MDPSVYCIWLMPEKKASQELYQIIKVLGHQHEAVLFDPHLTLTVIEAAKVSSPHKILDKVVSKLSVVTLDSPRLTTGNLFTQSIYLRFDDSELLNSLYASCCQVLTLSPATFYPHLSLIYKNLTEQQKKDILQSLTVVLKSVTFDVVRLVKSSAFVETQSDVKAWSTIDEKKLI